MKMYVANATRQTMQFLYRVPEIAGARSVIIPIGGQVVLPDDLQTEGVDMVLSQHERYGLVHVDKIKNAKEFTGLCYSLNTPVKHPSIAHLMDVNNEALVERGKKIREEAAIFSNGAIENAIAESTPGGFDLRHMEMSVVEEHPERNDTGKPVAEGYRITRDDNTAQPARRRKG